MRERFEHYKLLVNSLGFWQCLFYKLQQLRVRLLRIQRPVSLYSKYAKFPLRFRPQTSDHSVFFQIFVHREYRCLDNARDVNLIIDCGANVGYTSAYLLSRFPTARLIAIEPDPENYDMLQANLAPYGRYRAIRSAIWSHPAELVISGKELGGEWSRQVKPAGSADPATIPAIDIGTLLEESGSERISILKIDIEGAEAEVFSADCDGWLKRVDNLVIELHGEAAAKTFAAATANENFTASQCGELTVCSRF
jgi:FkbM family methyltransferase